MIAAIGARTDLNRAVLFARTDYRQLFLNPRKDSG